MKKIVYSCDICDYEMIVDDEDDNPLFDMKVTVGHDREVWDDPDYSDIVGRMKELCPNCKKKAIEDLRVFMSQSLYFKL